MIFKIKSMQCSQCSHNQVEVSMSLEHAAQLVHELNVAEDGLKLRPISELTLLLRDKLREITEAL
jgi:hypothetical protein